MAICKLCEKETDTLHDIAERYVLDLIQKDHPEWVKEDGSCEACIEYYKNLDDAVQVE